MLVRSLSGQLLSIPQSIICWYMKLLNQVKDLKFYIPGTIFSDDKKDDKAEKFT
jgi:hypothetical protein